MFQQCCDTRCGNSVFTLGSIPPTLSNLARRKQMKQQSNWTILMSTRSVLATEVECLMFRASMWRIRHTLISSCSPPPMGSIRLAGNSFLNQVHCEPNTATGMFLVHASSVIGLLQSDIKTALRSSFGSLDGPLYVTEWCKGRSGDAGTVGDGFASELTGGECRDSSSTVTLPVGEPPSPSQSSSLGSLGIKGGGRVEETSQWRSIQETSASESEQQLGFRRRPTLFVLPAPALLVGSLL